ncbi:hypothetical protein Y032_0929g3082 [Ancylostoma ceylanicum]|uniref:Uncharacterized protein n=2 Tax=Ancylostoma ceylanicum TaxID=53326 RepID=A0A016W969_9BILA|nr:hypothetical protein Y032_0929g3082 [Ancylostoma ceylanicum]
MQQPDRTGELGQSVAVHYSPKTGCRYTQGQSRIPKNMHLIQSFVHAINADHFAESRGPYSELLPLELITTLAFLENSTASELEEVAILIKAELGDKIVALTISGVNPVELGVFIRDEMLYSISEELTSRERGEVVDIVDFEEKLEHFISIPRFRDEKVLEEYLRQRIVKGPMHHGDAFTSDYSPLREVGKKYWVKMELENSDDSQLTYCYPGLPSVGSYLFEVVQDVGAIAKSSDVSFDFIPDQASAYLRFALNTLYEKISSYRMPSSWVSLYMVADSSRFETSTLSANMFSLTIGEEAYAYIGTIGTGFGSHSATAFMNNLVHNHVANFAKIKGFANTLQPFIALKNNTVSIVYSGSPGYPTLSLGIPRLIYTLILSQYFNKTLEEAVVYPLIYTMPHTNITFRYGYPFDSDFGKYINEKNIKIKDVPDHYGDSLAAISRREDDDGHSRFVPFYKNKRVRAGRPFNTRITGF